MGIVVYTIIALVLFYILWFRINQVIDRVIRIERESRHNKVYLEQKLAKGLYDLNFERGIQLKTTEYNLMCLIQSGKGEEIYLGDEEEDFFNEDPMQYRRIPEE